MYHLMPSGEEEYGDALIFLNEDTDPTNDLAYADYIKDGWICKGQYGLSLLSGEDMLPNSIEK